MTPAPMLTLAQVLAVRVGRCPAPTAAIATARDNAARALGRSLRKSDSEFLRARPTDAANALAETADRAAGRYALAMVEAGYDPAAALQLSATSREAGALIGLSGASDARRYRAHKKMREGLPAFTTC